MARCPDCSKFVGNDQAEPEAELEVDSDGSVTGTVRIANQCDQCGNELTEYTFDVEIELDEVEHEKWAMHQAAVEKDHEDPKQDLNHTLDITYGYIESTVRSEGRGRGTKTFYGYNLDFVVKCTCGETFSGKASDDVQASSMDSLS